MCEWTESDSLRKHMLAVETAVRAYARRFGADEEKWAVAGLVHDLDYERYPDPETGTRATRSRSCARAATRRTLSTRCSRTPSTWASRATQLLDRALFAL